jgi:hypothetical protein
MTRSVAYTFHHRTFILDSVSPAPVQLCKGIANSVASRFADDRLGAVSCQTSPPLRFETLVGLQTWHTLANLRTVGQIIRLRSSDRGESIISQVSKSKGRRRSAMSQRDSTLFVQYAIPSGCFTNRGSVSILKCPRLSPPKDVEAEARGV